MHNTGYKQYKRFLATLCAGAALSAGAITAHAEDDDTINPDRPDVAESSRVVGNGRLQLEIGPQWEQARTDGAGHERTLTVPTLLRIGIGESSELRFETDSRTITHANGPDGRETSAGWADTSVGVKWHLADQHGSRPSLGVLVDLALPVGSRSLRGSGVRPTVSLPAEWGLPNDWDLGLMPAVGVDRNDAGSRYTYGVFAATLGKGFSERLHGFAEVAATQIASGANGGTQALVDTGLTWLVNKDCQVDALIGHGLNRRTPDLMLGFGISIRR